MRAFALATLATVASLGLPALAAPPRAEDAAKQRRVAALVKAADLTAPQAETFFRQLIDPPLAFGVEAVASETRPDGTRNVFLLLAVDLRANCLSVHDPADCRGEDPALRQLFFVQLDPRGEVARTGRMTPFENAGSRPDFVPRDLRLVPPRPGAASIALVEGTRLYPAEDIGGGHFDGPTWVHKAIAWNGRDAVSADLSELADGTGRLAMERLGRVVTGEAGAGLVIAQVSCEAPCRCARPASAAAAEKELRRISKAPGCSVTSTPFPWPEDFRLVDDDLAARTPRRTASEAAAATPGELAEATGLPQATAEAIWARVGPIRAPRFHGFGRWPLADGGEEVIGFVSEDRFLACVYVPTRGELHDAVRACAAESGESHGVLFARVGPGGDVTMTRRSVASTVLPRAIHRTAPGRFAIESVHFRAAARGKPAFLEHALAWFGAEDRVRGTESISRLSGGERGLSSWEGSLGHLSVTPRGDCVTLTVRRLLCQPDCPCPAFTEDLDAVPALLVPLASNPKCRFASDSFGG